MFEDVDLFKSAIIMKIQLGKNCQIGSLQNSEK